VGRRLVYGGENARRRDHVLSPALGPLDLGRVLGVEDLDLVGALAGVLDYQLIALS